MTEDSSLRPDRIGFADVDAAASTSWWAISGPWIGLLPLLLGFGVVVAALLTGGR